MSNRIYTQVPVPKFPRNTFSLSRPVSGSMTFMKLYPTNAHVVVPGDGFIEGSEILAKMEPTIAPTFCKIDIDQHAFYVPFWQISEKFDDFISGGDDGKFTDKMPWMEVHQFFQIVFTLLEHDPDFWPLGIWNEDEDFFNAQAVYQEAKYRLDLACRIIEMCDYFRAVPFKRPDFVAEPVSKTKANIVAWIMGNQAAFNNLNLDLDDSGLRVNLCPFFAYMKVYSEYFADENLCENSLKWFRDNHFDELLNQQNSWDSKFTSLSQGCLGPVDPEFASDVSRNLDACLWYNLWACQRRAWKKDRFTGSLPFAQKGDDVLIPIHGIADVDNSSVYSGDTPGTVTFRGTNKQFLVNNSTQAIRQSVDLGAGNSATIRELREAYAAEDFVESNGRYGSRYPEFTLGQFGVVTPDARLPRAIFLGSRSQPVMISDVTQTSSTDDTSPQGNLAGKGSSYAGGRIFKFRFTLHGIVLVLTSIRVAAQYEGGIAPMFSYFDRTDYAFPRFARLGEEPVYTKELFIGDTSGEGDMVSDDLVFGYAPRYSSFKSDVGSIHGSLKTNRSFWTMSRRWNLAPKLNEEFIYAPPRLDAYAITNPFVDQFEVQIMFRCRAQRILPFWGTPSI